MALGMKTKRAKQIDGRRCCKCKKVAKDNIDGKYLCRIHSPVRLGFIEHKQSINEKGGNN